MIQTVAMQIADCGSILRIDVGAIEIDILFGVGDGIRIPSSAPFFQKN